MEAKMALTKMTAIETIKVAGAEAGSSAPDNHAVLKAAIPILHELLKTLPWYKRVWYTAFAFVRLLDEVMDAMSND